LPKSNILEVKILSSLEKIFAVEDINPFEWNCASMFLNEVYTFQVAYKWNGLRTCYAGISLESELSAWISIRKVVLVPSELPCYPDHDNNILSSIPGLYPDALMPVNNEGIPLVPNQWRSLWITINPKGNVKAKLYPIKIKFILINTDQELAYVKFELKIINALLPKQSLIHTQWLHSDCLSTWYNVKVFSKEYWQIAENYIRTAVNHGINMILTPLFTPPLDTAVGRERPTVQLIDVEIIRENNSDRIHDLKYEFGFERLKQWIDMCRANGVQYFEFSHLFTQWGAKHAPKIMAYENGVEKRIFGWETDANGDEYRHFLAQFLPSLVCFVKQNHLEDHVYFHVSDEPAFEQLESYKTASSILQTYLNGLPIIDALSVYQFYEKGIIKNPIVATDHIEPFLDNKVSNLWAYYCCGQYKDVSNRFFNMPSARNRILGMQLYKYNIKGFLQWGYNFWYSQYSIDQIDPYKVTDAIYAFPSGDAFIVYPGTNRNPVESLRLEVFYEALQDIRALKLLENYIGYEGVIDLLEKHLDNPITFKKYPKDALWLLNKREEINGIIAKLAATT